MWQLRKEDGVEERASERAADRDGARGGEIESESRFPML